MPVTIKRAPPSTPKPWKPMLAAEAVLGAIRYPKLALPKLNGVRGLNQGGRLLARSLKPIPNEHTRCLFGVKGLSGVDGELVVGDHSDEEVFTKSTSGVMTKVGEPDIHWYVFDLYHANWSYQRRLEALAEVVAQVEHPRVRLVPHRVIKNDDELVEYSGWALNEGYEGLVLRQPSAPYKQGRSTALEGGFMRYCEWFRSEAIIREIHEGKINQNVSKHNELGYLKKSTHKDNMVGSGRAGAWTVRDLNTGVEFNIPVPTDALQKAVMDNPERWLGRLIKYKFKPAVKLGGKPRFPQYEGVRSFLDMSV